MAGCFVFERVATVEILDNGQIWGETHAVFPDTIRPESVVENTDPRLGFPYAYGECSKQFTSQSEAVEYYQQNGIEVLQNG